MTMHGVTGRGYFLRPFFVGYARDLWNEFRDAHYPESPILWAGKRF